MALTVPLERISQEARRVDVRKGLLWVARLLATILVGVPYVVGWSLRKVWLGLAWVVSTAWVGLSMLWVAAATGWREGGGPRRAEGGSTS